MIGRQSISIDGYHQDLTRLESGGETSWNESFDLHNTVQDATQVYRNEAARRGIDFKIDVGRCPKNVIGDSRKIRTVIANLTANARMCGSHSLNFSPHMSWY